VRDAGGGDEAVAIRIQLLTDRVKLQDKTFCSRNWQIYRLRAAQTVRRHETYLVPLQIDADVRVQEVAHVVSGHLRDRQVAVVNLIQQKLCRVEKIKVSVRLRPT
jgi:hypothetical protein